MIDSPCASTEHSKGSAMKGKCKICGKTKELDGNGYCDDCYPYDKSTDRYDQHRDRVADNREVRR